VSNTQIPDQGEREQALRTDRSCIVQAPAGSGKTELLIQRYLRLLSEVNEPEEIIAITFTRKAAAEMHNRVLEALDGARGPEPDQSHARMTWDLARRVLQRDAELGWAIRNSTARLKIQTIDSLCSGLTRKLPILSTFGGQPGIAEDPEELYFEAARAAIRHLEQGREWGDAVATLLGHLDNNTPRLEQLLVSMLSKRDQWLRHVAGTGPEWLRRRELEQALRRAVDHSLEEIATTIPTEYGPEMLRLARFAAANLRADGKLEHPLLACLDLLQMPAATSDLIPAWRGLAEMLLTKQDKPRAKVDKNIGFPPANDQGRELCQEMKQAFAQLMTSLQGHPQFTQGLARVRALPPQTYSEQQWQVLQALFLFLKIAVAELRLVMGERGRVDFIEMALGARTALGDEEEPTDLALALDYRIKHLLVDEFQDTAHGQFELLQQLTRGWQPGDGRTLFLVGDPMQSIYRFREAEVGLYLRARQEGIGQVRMDPINLSVNFRSQQGIVEWVNQLFRQVLPEQEDMARGAVTYSASTPYHPGSPGAAVHLHPAMGRDDAAEAIRVRELVQSALGNSGDTVAILVRTRNHLAAIIPELKQAGIGFQAVAVEPLAECPVIYDLMALTRALLHPADRISWLAILRAPWCGLTLEDLLALAGDNHKSSVWELIQDPGIRASLSSDGQARLQRVVPVLQQGQGDVRRSPLHQLVAGTWLALGGAAVVRSVTELEQAQVLFGLLEQFDNGGDLDDFAALDQALQKLYAPPDLEADGTVQLMTMHAAKGLEFDHVIIPGLGRIPRVDESRLMYWLERNSPGGRSDLLLAPIKGSDEEHDPIYSYLRGLVTDKGRLEEGRLLYVAATRARKQLHLLGHAEFDSKRDRLQEPRASSLLASLWPAAEIRQAFQQLIATEAPDEEADAGPAVTSQPPGIRRLAADWALPPLERPPISLASSEQSMETMGPDALEFDWASETARHVGTLVHRYLQRIASEGADKWTRQKIDSLRPAFANALVHLGVPGEELDTAVIRVGEALTRTIADQRGGWILSRQHQEARSEYALSAMHNQKLVNIIVDRTFVDADGTRWIIDYKTGMHAGSDVDGFLDQEQERYRGQLERYAAVFRRLEQRPIRLGLYFPLLSGWRSWEAG
jgi:ATP-dependent helicase/nuclease subunit A